MISWEDVYKVLVAMVPFYSALALGYSSVRWWRMFKPEHCGAINAFTCYFIIPFFTFEFISHINPYKLNYRFLTADVISKCIIGIVLALWANFSSKGKLSSSIMAFSLASLNNTLIVGVPFLKAMYDELGQDIVVQSSLIQALLWVIILLFLLELRNAKSYNINIIVNPVPGRSETIQQDSHSIEMITDASADPTSNNVNDVDQRTSTTVISNSVDMMLEKPALCFGAILKIICLKMAKNPNVYACFVGIIWGLLANRWKLQMPSIIEGSILIMSKAGGGVAMFNMGLFMALQEKLIACGVRKTLFGMLLRFVVAPATMAIGSLAMGLHGEVLKVAVIQAALPQAVMSFVFAQEYGLHPDVLSTAVIFGTMVSLPLLIAYYAILEHTTFM